MCAHPSTPAGQWAVQDVERHLLWEDLFDVGGVALALSWRKTSSAPPGRRAKLQLLYIARFCLLSPNYSGLLALSYSQCVTCYQQRPAAAVLQYHLPAQCSDTSIIRVVTHVVTLSQLIAPRVASLCMHCCHRRFIRRGHAD